MHSETIGAGARTSFRKVRAHSGLPVNAGADEWAAKGHTSVISLGEDRELVLDHDLHLHIDRGGTLI